MTEKTKVQTGGALYASNKPPAPAAKEAGAIAKGRANYAARTGKGIQLEAAHGDDE